MFEPQGTGFFLLLMVVFGGLLVWVALARQIVFRVFAACLAFLPAMVLRNRRRQQVLRLLPDLGRNDQRSDRPGREQHSQVRGRRAAPTSNSTRTSAGSPAWPKTPRSDTCSRRRSPACGATSPATCTSTSRRSTSRRRTRHYKFPVIELLHGSPGNPQAWVDVMGVIPTFLNLLEAHPTDAAVLVMPDTDGGQQYALQCLNDPGGIQDMTFVALDVPAAIARIARVQPPGRAWGLAGYSEGGYCTANIALQDPAGYGAAGVMSGYFAPDPEHGARGQQAGREAGPGQRVPRASQPAAHQHAAGLHHPGAGQRCAPRLLARGRRAGQARCHRRGAISGSCCRPGWRTCRW